MNNIPFNKPFLTGKETQYISEAVNSGKISGDGMFTKKCHNFFETRFAFKKSLLTSSCTDALELAALLLNIGEGDEIILPSYTFVSTANAFALRGARLIFADSSSANPNIDVTTLEELITSRTKAIVPVHYAGIACDMDVIVQLAQKFGLYIVEDAAQAIDSYYKGKPLGGIGHMGAFSFHETKNVIAGEGGMLAISDSDFISRAEILREKGTNRSAFFRGEVNKYGWVDVGSSFLPSEIIAAFLFAQLENLELIQQKRRLIWERYFSGLKDVSGEGFFTLPYIPDYASNNAHMFYIVLHDGAEARQKLINFLKEDQILSVFHYLSLHSSPYFKQKHDGRKLKSADYYSDNLLRLPLYFDLQIPDVDRIIDRIHKYFKG